MTEIEQKALALVNEARVQDGMFPFKMGAKMDASNYTFTALCRAIEQHEAFRRKVSDACKKWTAANVNCREPHDLDRFIIPEPVDPLVEAIKGCELATLDAIEDHVAEKLRAAMKALGYEFTKIGEAGE